MKSVNQQLSKSVLILLGVTGAESEADIGIHRKVDSFKRKNEKYHQNS